MNYNGTEYYYMRNGQNDIVGLMDSSGAVVVSYSYDAWGKLLSVSGTLATTLGANNPFRYRGYYYDTETGLYYLQTRYYDATVCRFISADVYMSTGQGIVGNNTYAYCLNNPVMMSDDSGLWPTWNQLFAVVAVVAIVAVVAVVSVATVGVGTTLLVAAAGATIGVAGKYVEDITLNALNGKKGADILKPVSSLEDYASSGITGAVTGMLDAVAPGTGKLAKNAIDAGLKPLIKQNLEIASGARIQFNASDYAWDAGKRFVTSFLKLPGAYTTYPGINKMIGNLLCNIARGAIKHAEKKYNLRSR